MENDRDSATYLPLIRDLVSRYNVAGDSHSLESMLDVFSDDARYQSVAFNLIGIDQIRSYFENAWSAEKGRTQDGFRRHHITTMQIDLADKARASGIIYYLVMSDIGVDHCGYYRDDYVLREGRWKIARRRVWMEWVSRESRFVPEQSQRLLREQGVTGPADD